MRKLYWITAILFFFGNAAFAGESHYTLQVDGLVCPFCEYNIEKKVSQLDGVTGVKANLKDGVVSVKVADGATLPEAAVRQAITDAGFTLKSIDKHQ